jgi:hypothetical protein
MTTRVFEMIGQLVGNDIEQRQKAEQSLTALPWEQRASILSEAGTHAYFCKNFQTAERCYDTVLSLARDFGSPHEIATALLSLTGVAKAQGDHNKTRRLMEERVDIARQHAASWNGGNACFARTLMYLGEHLLRHYGETHQARILFEESLVWARRSREQHIFGDDLFFLSVGARLTLDYPAACVYGAESLRLRATRDDDMPRVCESLDEIVCLEVARRQSEHVACLLGVLDKLDEEEAAEHASEGFHTPGALSEAVRQARETLGAHTFAALWEKGRAMEIEQVVEYAIAALDGN